MRRSPSAIAYAWDLLAKEGAHRASREALLVAADALEETGDWAEARRYRAMARDLPEGLRILTPGQMRAIKDRERRYEKARTANLRRGGYAPGEDRDILRSAGLRRQVTNDERALVFVTEFLRRPNPRGVFAYYNDTLTEVQIFTGQRIGDIVHRGREYVSFGNRNARGVAIRVRGINGRLYAGRCNRAMGTYCSLRLLPEKR